MRAAYVEAIKTFEGFTPRAEWDYAQHTNGFGTKARHAGEVIDAAEANRRFMAEISEARRFVEAWAGDWDEGTKSALTSLTFNAGTRWAKSGLGDALKAGDADAVRERFLTYTRAGGVVLPGLVRRRLEEVTWIGTTFDAQRAAPTTNGEASPASRVAMTAAVDAPGAGAPGAGTPNSATANPIAPAVALRGEQTSPASLLTPDTGMPAAPASAQSSAPISDLTIEAFRRYESRPYSISAWTLAMLALELPARSHSTDMPSSSQSQQG